MPDLLADFADTFAHRVAERDNPPPVVISQEPAAIQARLEQWLHTTYAVRNASGRRRQALALLALMQSPELETIALGQASGPPAVSDRQAGRLAAQLLALGLTIADYRGLYRYHRLSRAAEDELLAVVRGAATG